ncbi:MAG TPA: penicillin-binding transpeptidase domain-containing protein [Solirubrobacteraceae bacterium]|nr:penicillin-binding transpeptidase domain-containing protein [Solirubrobacteraceae bacterium]
MNTSHSDRRTRIRRVRAVIALAALAFLIGAIVGAGHGGSPAIAVAERFATAWSHGNYAAMYADVDDATHRRISAHGFADAYRQAARTATETALVLRGKAKEQSDGTVLLPILVSTRVWGQLAEKLRLQAVADPDGEHVHWSHALLFPGLAAGESLSRQTRLPTRAVIQARDGTVLADGEASGAGTRSSPLGAAADAAIGEVGAIPSARANQLEAEGVPNNAIVGVSGLELAFDSRLRGRPGGELLAGGRVLASAPTRPGETVRSTISAPLQRSAAAALGGQLGGVVALDPRSGEVLAVAGLGIDDLQPPGSTFKMVTLTAVLEAKVASTKSEFPYASSTLLDGVKLENANGESCGGSLALAFAVSCNSVFAPLGVKVGAQRLVATAEDYGFNHPPTLPGAVESTLPPASQIQGELDLGSTAIGQGEVQASALQMATVAATIADGGRKPSLGFQAQGHPLGPRVVAASTARTVRRLMIDVVREGTGTSAAIPGITVAGKTGTAELGESKCSKSESESSESTSESQSGSESCSGSKDPQNTDAWFAAFAPALTPKIAVGVLMVKDGAGGETAAPVAKQVIEAALH